MTISRNIITALCLVSAFVSSLFFYGTASIWFAPSMIIIVVLAGVSLWWAESFPKSTTIYLILCWWGYLAITCVTASIPFNAILFFCIFSIVPLLFFTAIISKKPEERLKLNWHGLLIAVAILAVWAIVQFFILPDKYGPRIHHPLHNPNTLAGIFTLFLLPVIGEFFTSIKPKKRIVFLLLAMLFFAGVLVTNSRGAMLSGLIAFILLCLFIAREKGFFKSLIIIGASFLAVYFLTHLSDSVEKFHTFEQLSSVNVRMEIWTSTWQMIKDNPLWGTGLGSFYAFYPEYRSILDRSAGFWVHSDPLQFWVELGFLGVIIFYALLIAILWRSILAFKNTKYRIEILLPFFGLFACLLHTHITFHLYQPAILIPLALLLARWYWATEKAIGDGNISFKLNQNTQKIIAVLLVLGFSFWIVKAATGIYLVKNARMELESGNIEKFAKQISQADKVSPRSYIMPQLYMAEFHAAMLKQEKSINLIDELLTEAEKQNPKELAIKHARAKLYAMTGSVDKAEEIWSNNLVENPRHILSRMELAESLIENKKTEEALNVLQEGLYWPYAVDTREYYQRTLEVYAMLGQVEKYQELESKIKTFHLLQEQYLNKQREKKHSRIGIKPLLVR